MKYRSRKQPIPHGRPALVFVRNGKTVTINGKKYYLLDMFYDLKGEYQPLATMRPL